MKIILNCIVKNESKVILRMLSSVLPLIDEYAILDTGSTDGTPGIIRNFFKENNIPGEVTVNTSCTEEIDGENYFLYDKARNAALGLIKDKDGMLFYIDADEQLILPKDFNSQAFKEKLSKYDQGQALVSYNNNRYGRNCFVRIKKPIYWQEPIHEVLLCNETLRGVSLPEITILVISDGNTWSPENVKNKYANHAKILLKEFERTGRPRTLFYLAQSFRDAGDVQNAILYYKKRALMKEGFYEEAYYSQLMAADLTGSITQDIKTILPEYLLAHELDPLRGENILNMIIQLQNNNLWNTAYIFGKFAVEAYHKKNPYPNRILFLHQGTYDHLILDVHTETCRVLNKLHEINKFMDLEKTYADLCARPSDINYHLPKLREYASKSETVVEMGVRWVVSSYALLAARPKKLISYDINYHPSIDALKAVAKKENIDFTFIQSDVLSIEIESCDFLFIDTKHTYLQLKQELTLHASKAKKYLAFHDTFSFGFKNEFDEESTPSGLWPAIDEFLKDNPEWVVDYKTEENNGLTVLARKALAS